MKPIFTYIDYRQFLRDYYEEKKRQTRYFSYRFFAKKSGINSPAFLKLIIEGKRNLTDSACSKFCTALDFTTKEALFFKHLVSFNQAKTAIQKQEHYAVLVSLMQSIKEYRISATQYGFYGQWYHAAIRELICLHNFKDDFEAIANAVQPPLKFSDARASVQLLLKLNLVKKNPDGSYQQTQPAIMSDSALVSPAIRNLNREMGMRALEAIDRFPREQRQIYGLTIGISPACYDVLTTELAAFRDRVVALVSKDTLSSRVYQMNFQFFPLSGTLANDEGINKKDAV